MECVWFVFSDFLQLELDKVKDEWNMHFIRQSRHNTVSGVPDELCYLPQTRGFGGWGFEVSAPDIENMLNQRDIYEQNWPRMLMMSSWSILSMLYEKKALHIHQKIGGKLGICMRK